MVERGRTEGTLFGFAPTLSWTLAFSYNQRISI